MPLDIGMDKYPICDTDIWIKSCKLKKENEIFKKYGKIFFADAVKQELFHKKGDSQVEFGNSVDKLEIYIDKYIDLELKGTFFNSKERKSVKRAFIKEKIDYDFETGLFPRDKNTGEKVSVIYAHEHRLKVVLSDDNGTEEFRKKVETKYKNIEVINLLDFLVSLGIDLELAEKMKNQASKSLKEKEEEQIIKEHVKNGICQIDDISLLKTAFYYKK